MSEKMNNKKPLVRQNAAAAPGTNHATRKAILEAQMILASDQVTFYRKPIFD